MRLAPDSSAAAQKLVNVRSAAAGFSDFRVKPTASVPKKSASTAAPAALKVLCPEVYAGNGGVGMSGVQFGSAAVSGLPSASAARMAVTGRHRSKAYLQSHEAIPASARAMFKSANSRAFSASV